MGTDACLLEGRSINLITRLNGFEKKIDWLVQELHWIKEALEANTKAIQASKDQSFVSVNSRKPIHPKKHCNHGTKLSEQPNAIRPYPINAKDLPNGNMSFAALYPSGHVVNWPNGKREDYQSNGSSDEKTSTTEDSENRESTSESASKSPSDEYDSDIQTYRERLRMKSNVAIWPQRSRDSKVYREFMTDAPQLKNLHSESIFGLDVIYLWEYGADEMLPVRLWNDAELEAGGDVIKRWEKIMEIFRGQCGGSLKTFVSKYTNSDGMPMSVKEILSHSAAGSLNNVNCLTIPENSSFATSFGSSSEVNSKAWSFVESLVNGNSNKVTTQWGRNREPCFILPRKINGQKVSAKDVVRIWDEGFCNIPPVKNWTPNQKLKQQSKISRWKKVIDIFKTECDGDMNVFEKRYSSDCGAMLPIAAIINKYEQSQAAADAIDKPPESNVSTVTSSGDAKVNVFQPIPSDGCAKKERSHELWRSSNRLNELAREWDLVEAQSCKERRAFTIQQVEKWQRNSIQPIERVNATEHLPPSGINMPKAVEEQGKLLMGVPLPILNQSNLQPAPKQASPNRDTAAKEMSEGDLAKGDFPKKPRQDTPEGFTNGETFTAAQDNDEQTCPGVQKEAEELSVSDSVENSSCKDIDVTGSITSESSVASKTYNPVLHKKSSDLLKKDSMKSEVKDSSQEDICRNTIDKPQTMFKSSTSISSEFLHALPESDDPFEVLNLWEHGRGDCPPIRFLAIKQEFRDPRLVTWRRFIDIFHFECNSDQRILMQKFSDENGRPMHVSEIVQRFGAALLQRQREATQNVQSGNHCSQVPSTSSYKVTSEQLDMKSPSPESNIYTLPRKINGHKVSAKDVIHIWHHGLKSIPAVKSWLPHQKIRQQSKISRWKKIVEIFGVDCQCSMELFEKKYSNKSGDMLPIAAIIAKYEAEKLAIEGDTGLNIKVDTMT